MECEYCKSNFKTIKNLSTHQKTAKYCIKLQTKPTKISYDCCICKKQFTSNNHRNNHEKLCVSVDKFKEVQSLCVEIKNDNNKKNKIILDLEDENYELLNEIEKYKQKIIEYDRQLIEKDLKSSEKECEIYKKMSEKPQAVNITNNTKNNININLTPMSFDKTEYENILRNAITENSFQQIPNDIITLIINEILLDSNGKLKYICTDKSRKKCKWKNKNGKICYDQNAEKLSFVVGLLQNIVQDVQDQQLNQKNYDRPKHGFTSHLLRKTMYYINEYLKEPLSFANALCDKLVTYNNSEEEE